MSEKNGKLVITAPMTGRIVQLTDVPSGKFAEKMMGEGIAIEPQDGKVVSPVEGEVIQAFPTRHALTIQTDSTVEVMVHVGIDTERLEGENFKMHVKEKDKVKVGDPLITYDYDFAQEHLTSLCSPIIVVNPNKINSYSYTNEKEALRGETILIEGTLDSDQEM